MDRSPVAAAAAAVVVVAAAAAAVASSEPAVAAAAGLGFERQAQPEQLGALERLERLELERFGWHVRPVPQQRLVLVAGDRQELLEEDEEGVK